MWALLSEQLGAVPRRLIWDNETGIGRRNRLAAGVGEFAGALATRIHQLKAYDPESKGGVERINGYFETSFLPGRDFASPGDFNTQLSAVAAEGQRPDRPCAQGPPGRPAGRRQGGDARVAPARAGRMGSLAGSGCRGTTTSGSLGNDYSVHPAAIGRMVDVVADLDVGHRPARRTRRSPTTRARGATR